MSRWHALAISLALGFAVGACASSADTGFPDPSEVPSDTAEPGGCSSQDEEPTELDGHVLVLDDCYEPKNAIVAAGDEIIWEQEGTNPHTVTIVDGEDSHPDCSFDDLSACMAAGDQFTFAFDEAGEFVYYCRLHGTEQGGGMAGTITVE